MWGLVGRLVAFEVDGDALGFREDVLFEGDGDVAEGMAGEEVVGDFEGERLDEASGFGGGEGAEFEGDGVVVDGAGNVVREAVEGAGGGEVDGGEEGLGGGAFVVRHDDVGRQFEAADFDDVRGRHRG